MTTAYLMRRWLRYHHQPDLTFGHPIPELGQNTNPQSPARLYIQIETSIGSRTVITSALPRLMASAIVLALASKGVHAAMGDDHGSHTVADLVKRARRRQKRMKAFTNVVPMKAKR